MRDWSLITAAQLRAYISDAQRLVALAKEHKISTFAAALAGVAIAVMGGKPEWWYKLITSTNPIEEFIQKSNNDGE